MKTANVTPTALQAVDISKQLNEALLNLEPRLLQRISEVVSDRGNGILLDAVNKSLLVSFSNDMTTLSTDCTYEFIASIVIDVELFSSALRALEVNI